MAHAVTTAVLEEMVNYYRARAAEYDQWWDRVGRYDRGPGQNQRWFTEREQVYVAFDALSLRGSVLELAPGTGIWTQRLVHGADSITAVDAAPEMIAINRARVGSAKVQYLQADLFQWRPERTYDAVVFGFWISHVPEERLHGFLDMVAQALRPGGRFFFVDNLRESTSTAANHILPDAETQVMMRRLNDERAFRIVKRFYTAEELAAACARVGLQVQIRTTPTYFYYGVGCRG